MYQTILTHTEQGICTITINRPDKMNALNKDVIQELGAALEAARIDTAVQALILTGAGEKAFVAGADITEFTELQAAGGKALATVGAELVFNKIEQFTKPIIAAVNGFALGGGCELAMACHFRIASENAKFGQPEVNLGLIPGYGGTQRLTQLIGKGKAMELLMTADMITASEALQLGLVNHVVPKEELLSLANLILTKICTKAPIAIQHIIHLVNQAAIGAKDGLQQEIDLFGACFDTEDKKEGISAFLEKRKASFKGA